MAAPSFLKLAQQSLHLAWSALDAGLEALAAAQIQEAASLESHLLAADRATQAAWEAVQAALEEAQKPGLNQTHPCPECTS